MTTISSQNEFVVALSSGIGAGPMVLGSSIADLTGVLYEGVAAELDRHSLEFNDFAVLQLLRIRDEWTAAELSEHLPLNPPRMSYLVAKLSDRRLVRRRRTRKDRRIVLLSLTERGRTLIDEVRNGIQAHEALLLKGISSTELSEFQDAVHKIVTNHQQRR